MKTDPIRLLVSAIFAVGAIATDTSAQEPVAKELRLAPQEIKLPAPGGGQIGTSGVAGIQMATVSGDPKKAGLYTIIIKVPPNTTIQAHSHPDDRIGVVVSGTWYFAFGDKFDQSALKALPAGSFYTEPPSANHFAMTKDEAATVYITGTGPTGTVYVNKADDPRNR